MIYIDELDEHILFDDALREFLDLMKLTPWSKRFVDTCAFDEYN